MMKMKPEIKAKWIAALRSGDYLQAQSALKAEIETNYTRYGDPGPTGFCCLGVLCDLYRKEVESDYWDRFDMEDLETDRLPDEVAKWAGIVETYHYGHSATPDEISKYNIAQPVLAHKNDMNVGGNFEEIADAIENFVEDSTDTVQAVSG